MTPVQSPPKPIATAGQTRHRSKMKPSCADCYFGRRMLCALELGEPCSTFRPDSPEGLVPPTQPMLLVRSEPDPLASPQLAEAA